MAKALKELGLKQSPFDKCLFYSDTIIMAILCVNDAGLSFKNVTNIELFFEKLKAKGFEFTREGNFADFLGIKFEQCGDADSTLLNLI